MNTATYDGVIRVLFPNCNGGHSESYSVADRSGQDGIQPNTLYVVGQIPGERVLWEAVQTGTPASASLVPVYAGKITSGAPYAKALYSDQSLAVAGIDVGIIPGMVGKVRVGHMPTGGLIQPDPTYAATRAVLFPNTGNTGQNNAHSEQYRLWSENGANALRPGLSTFYPEVAGEYPLLAIWRRQ